MTIDVLTTGEAWQIYDGLLSDPRTFLSPEPESVESTMRSFLQHGPDLPAPKWIGDMYLLAFAREIGATLVTFDHALHGHAVRLGHAALVP